MSIRAVSSTKKSSNTTKTAATTKTSKKNIKFFSASKTVQNNNQLPVISDVAKQAVRNITRKLKLNNYTTEVVKDYETMVQKSQSHLIGLIKFYEGDRNFYYEAFTGIYQDKTIKQTDTNGFGSTLNLKIKTLDQAYLQLEKDLVKFNNIAARTLNINLKLGNGFYESLPTSIREGLTDLCFNKGPGTIIKNKELVRALKNKDYSTIIWNLQYLYSSYDTDMTTPLAGLYRRSLSRAILAIRDIKTLSPKEAQEADAMIDKLYRNAVAFYKNKNYDTKDLDDVYNFYKSGSTEPAEKPATTETESKKTITNASSATTTENNGLKTYRINQEKMGIFSIAKSMRPNSCGVTNLTGLLKAIMAAIVKINNIKTEGNDENGYPKVGLQTRNTVLKLPTKIKFEGKIITLNAPAEMEELTVKQTSTAKKATPPAQKTNTSATKANLFAKKASSSSKKTSSSASSSSSPAKKANSSTATSGSATKKASSSAPKANTSASKEAASNKNNKNDSIVKGTYNFVVDTTFEGKGAYAVAKANYEKQGTTEITFSEFYNLFKAVNSPNDINNIKIGDSLKVPLVSGGKLPANAVLNTPEQEQKQIKTQQKRDGNIATRFLKGIYNKVFEKKHELSQKMRENAPVIYENDPNSIPFQNVMKEKNKKITKYTYITKHAGKNEKHSIYEVSLDYKVKDFRMYPNETVWGISHRFGVDMETFCKTNGIKDFSQIEVGQIVNIKKFAYKVEKGETLLSISKKFGLTPDILMQLNGIDEGEADLEAGRMIELPGFMYKVKKGETFESIAAKVGVNPDVLRQINGNKITVGKEIRVLYNNPDYDQTPEAVETEIVSGKKIEKIDMSNEFKILKNPKYRYLRYKRKVDGLVVANREVFLPTNKNGKLKGYTIIVNAGHGYSQATHPDPGAVVEKDGLKHEWILNYDNSMKLISQLQAQGARVIFLQGYKFLIQKAMKEEENKGDLFISVHANTGNGKSSPVDRPQFYYRDNVEKGEARTRSIKFAKKAEEIFDNNYNSKKYSQVSTNDERTGVLKAAVRTQKIPGIIWEVAFMDSPEGRKRLQNETTMNDYSRLMTQAVIKHFEEIKK